MTDERAAVLSLTACRGEAGAGDRRRPDPMERGRMAEVAADVVVRAGTVHTMDPAAPPVTGIAMRQGRIIAVARPGEELDGVVGPRTTVLDDTALAVLPAFIDTHNHLMLAGRNVLGVPVSRATGIAEFVELVRERAARTPAGEWILTGADWHEGR